MKEKISLERIEDSTERNIILLLQEKDKCMMGDILMNLKLSYQKGLQHINSLLDKDWISNTENAPYFTLKVEFE
jgi:hypothetical protein